MQEKAITKRSKELMLKINLRRLKAIALKELIEKSLILIVQL